MIEKSAVSDLPTVVIVGRINVGKSTLFNRLTDSSAAIVSAIPGTTRDWKEKTIEWNGRPFHLIDTGGLEDIPTSKKRGGKGEPTAETIQSAVERQAWGAVRNADCLVVLVDGETGILPQDRAIARAVRRLATPHILVVNKIDAPRDRQKVGEHWNLGLGEPMAISAHSGMGTGDLLDAVVATFGEAAPVVPIDTPPIRIAIIGRPNVGKSSLVNALFQSERVIVSPIPGTTREPIDVPIVVDGRPYVLVDTAGIRRKATKRSDLESEGVDRTIRALGRADCALFVIDSNEPLQSQDLRLADELINAKVAVVVVANKWDIVRAPRAKAREGETDRVGSFTREFHYRLPHLTWAPIVTVSALLHRGLNALIPTVDRTVVMRNKQIPDDVLEAWMKKFAIQSIEGSKEKKPYIYGIKQTDTAPPRFMIVAEIKKLPTRHGVQITTVRPSYIRFLERRIRNSFGFEGTPILVEIRGIKK